MPSYLDVSSEPLPALEPREVTSHKGTYGRVLLVGGSRGMAGSIAMAGIAAMRAGAGLATVATPRVVQGVVASFSPLLMTVGLADDDDHFAHDALPPLQDLAEEADVVAIGPGLGRSASVRTIVAALYRHAPKPMVVDADALNGLAELEGVLESPHGPRILTPHPGEMARLLESKLGDTDQVRASAATTLAAADPVGQTIVVLKGHRTVIARADQVAYNSSGNPGMATAGAGDVLTGIIAGLLAQGLPPWDAARLGAYLHGLAGDLAAAEKGQMSLVATDLIDFLSTAIIRWQAT
jgi:ADP-dependent NAD(P)H-hydrate dehydratase